MAGIFSAIGALEKIYQTVRDIKEDPKNAVKTYEEATKRMGMIKTDGSITKFLSKFIVEPVVIISKDAKNTEYADKLITLNTDMFASFYLQAFHALNNLYGFEAHMAIHLLSTDSDTAIGKAVDLGMKTGLQWYADHQSHTDYFTDLLNNKYLSLSHEAKYHNDQRVDVKDTGFKNKTRDLIDENLYYVNHRELSINMTLNNVHEKEENGKQEAPTVLRTVIIPITIKTHVIVAPFDNIINMLKPNDRTKSFGYRLDEWKSGAISLADLIFCGDLIKSYKKNKLKDKEGLISIIKQREESANAKFVDTKGIVGFEKFYNMLIVTADEKILLNKHVGGNIDNEKYKQELLTQAHALTISILDDDYERVYIMTKDIRGRSDISYKTLSKKNNKSTDTEDILKALMANRAPAF